MKVKVKNKKTKVIKSIDEKLLGDYLATKEWIKYEEQQVKESKEKTARDSYSMEDNSENK